MTHPEELLAGYVDNTLSAPERKSVEDHLESCARCSSEVDMATMATQALAALAAPTAPEGLGDAAIEEARGSRGRSAAAPRWYRAASVVAAAAVIGLIAISLPRLGRQQNTEQTKISAAGDAGGQNPSAPEGAISIQMPVADAQILIQENTDYDAEALQDMAIAASDGQVASPEGTPGTEQETAKAIACLTNAGASADAIYSSLLLATFEKKPAVIGVSFEGAGAGQPPDEVLVWAVDLDPCQVLAFVQHPIG